MRATARLWVSFCSAAAGLALCAIGCNAILGYDAATLETSGADSSTDAGPCGNYCNAIMAACTGAHQEYLNLQVCNSMCPVFDPGTSDDTTQDSLACRINHLAAARANPQIGCPQAGPTGAGACGTDPCTAFCALDVNLCVAPNPVAYTSEIQCDQECDSDAGAYPYDASAGDLTQLSGNTLNCRVYHLESAYDTTDNTASAATTHCPHTAQVSATCH